MLFCIIMLENIIFWLLSNLPIIVKYISKVKIIHFWMLFSHSFHQFNNDSRVVSCNDTVSINDINLD